jgi:GTP-binding protein EngB required for normal cell division
MPDASLGSEPDPSASLAAIARELHDLASERPAIARRASRLIERLGTRRFHLAVVGDFKRGKSTLVNALVGRSVLPTGVVPLTAVATEVHVGAPSSFVVYLDGRREEIEAANLARYVTESGNPNNSKRVDHVEVAVTSTLGIPGLVLVDTPGLASVYQHNTVAAHEVVDESDGAILVLSADSPLSETERATFMVLSARQRALFVVINKCDHLGASEIHEVKGFVRRQLDDQRVPIFCVSARAALEGQGSAGQFEYLSAALSAFVVGDLEASRVTSARAELHRLTSDLIGTLRVAKAASALDTEHLDEVLGRFADAGNNGRRRLEEDFVVLAHDVGVLADGVGTRLAQEAANAAAECQSDLRARLTAAPLRDLDGTARALVEELVRSRFDPIQRRVLETTEKEWLEIAQRCADRVQERVDVLAATASSLFDIHLPSPQLPAVSAQRERFSYHFVFIESPNALVGRALRRLLPPRVLRQRAQRAAQARLVQEFDKHAGRARYDLSQRLDAATMALMRSWREEFAETSSSISSAAEGGAALRQLGTDEQVERVAIEARLDELLALIGVSHSASGRLKSQADR